MAVDWIVLGGAAAAALAGSVLSQYVGTVYNAASQRAALALSNLIRRLPEPSASDQDVSYLADDSFDDIFKRVFASKDSEISTTEVMEEPQESRIERLSKSLRESEVLIAELQAEMNAKVAAVERLRAEEEQSRQLASLKKEEAKAVHNLISATIASAHLELQGRLERERDELRSNLTELQKELATMQKSGLRQQILFLAIGILFSIPIGIGINIVW